MNSLWLPLRRVCLLSLLALAGCMTQQQRIAGADAARDAGELNNWTASGRIGVSSAEQAGSGGFTWLQQADLSQVQLRGPVGVGGLQLSLQGTHLRIQSSDGAQYDADQAMAELETRLGAAVPVAQLRYWLLGLPAPGAHQWLDEPNQVLEQEGWRIVYVEWSQRGSLRLPAKLILSRDQLRITIVVQSWQLASG